MSEGKSEEVFKHIDKHFNEYVEYTRRYLQQPGISITGEGMPESAAMALKYIEDVGAEDAKIVPTDGYPAVYGKLKSKNPKAKTLIFYTLYDEVPVFPEAWTYPPFGAEIVDAEKIKLPKEYGKVIVARAAQNQRGNWVTVLSALKSMLEVTGDIPVNIIFVCDGEEEIGSPHWLQFLKTYERQLREGNGCYGNGFRQGYQSWKLNEKRPFQHYIVGSYRGMCQFELEVKGGEWGGNLDARDLNGNQFIRVDSAPVRLLQAVNSLYGPNDEILIEGFYDNIRPLTSEEQMWLDRLKNEFDEETAKRDLNVRKFKKGKPGKELFEKMVVTPFLNIDGLVSGYTKGHTTVLPQRAIAKCDIKSVPDQKPDDLKTKLRKHLDKHGFNMVEIKGWTGYEGCITPISCDLIQAAVKATKIHKIEPLVWPRGAVANPKVHFTRPPFNMPVAFFGLGIGGNTHTANEFCTVEGMRDNIKYQVTFLNEYAKM